MPRAVVPPLPSTTVTISARDLHIPREQEHSILSNSSSRVCWSDETNHSAPVAATAPMHVRRSVSASYLDNVDSLSVPMALDIATESNPGSSNPKRLVLVKNLGRNNNSNANNHPRSLKSWGKSKSWDSYDLKPWKAGLTCEPIKSPTTPCPKCNFPSTTPLPDTHVIPFKKSSLPPKTPMRSCRKNSANSSGSSSSTSANTSGYNGNSVPKTPVHSRRNQMLHVNTSRSDHEDEIIPIAPVASPEELPSADSNVTRCSPAVNNSFSARMHRRSMSLLTPLLKRRELSRDRKENSEVISTTYLQEHRPSSSFIPPASPQHQARSSPSTPAMRRRQKYLSSAASPFRQFFANSPLLTRRRNNKNTSQTVVIDSSDEEDSTNGSSVGAMGDKGSKNKGKPTNNGTCGYNGESSFRDLESFQRNQLRQKVRYLFDDFLANIGSLLEHTVTPCVGGL